MGDIRTSARGVRLLRFLKRKPMPAKLIGETEDGEEIECVLTDAGPATYGDAAGVLRDCVKVTAVDEKGRRLRVCHLDPQDPELRAEAELKDAVGAMTRSSSSVPIISVDLPKLVDNIARNIRETASEAARQNANAHKSGFDAMISVVNIALQLLVGVEQRLALAETQLQQREPEEGDQRTELVKAAISKAMGGSNGAGIDMTKLGPLLSMIQNGGAQASGGDDGHS